MTEENVIYIGETKTFFSYPPLAYGTVLHVVEDYPEDKGVLVRTITYPLYLFPLAYGEFDWL